MATTPSLWELLAGYYYGGTTAPPPSGGTASPPPVIGGEGFVDVPFNPLAWYISQVMRGSPAIDYSQPASSLLETGQGVNTWDRNVANDYFNTVIQRLRQLSNDVQGNPTSFNALNRLADWLTFLGPAGLFNLFNVNAPGQGDARDLWTDYPFLNPNWNPSQGPAITDAGLARLQPRETEQTVSGVDPLPYIPIGTQGAGISPTQLLAGIRGDFSSVLSNFFGPTGPGNDLFNPVLNPTFNFSNVDIPGLEDLIAGIGSPTQRSGLFDPLSRAQAGLTGLSTGIGDLSSRLGNSLLNTGLFGPVNELGQRIAGFQLPSLDPLTDIISGLTRQTGDISDVLSRLSIPNLGPLSDILGDLTQQAGSTADVLSRLSIPSTTQLSTILGDLTRQAGSISNILGDFALPNLDPLRGLITAAQGVRLPDTSSLSALLGQVPSLQHLLGQLNPTNLLNSLSQQVNRLETIGGGGGRITATDFANLLTSPQVRQAWNALLPTSTGGGFNADLLSPLVTEQELMDLLGTQPGSRDLRTWFANQLDPIWREISRIGTPIIGGGVGSESLSPNWWMGDTSNTLQGWLNQQLWSVQGPLGRIERMLSGSEPFNPKIPGMEDILLGMQNVERALGNFDFAGLTGRLDPINTRLDEIMGFLQDPTKFTGGIPPDGLKIGLDEESLKALRDLGQDLLPGQVALEAPRPIGPGMSLPSTPWSGETMSFTPPVLNFPQITDYQDILQQPLLGTILGRLGQANPYDARMNDLIAGPQSELDKQFADAERNLVHRYSVLNPGGSPTDLPQFREELRQLNEAKAREGLNIRSRFAEQAAALQPSWQRGQTDDLSQALAQAFGITTTQMGLQSDLQSKATDDFYRYLNQYQQGYLSPQSQQDEALRLMLGGIGSTLTPDVGSAMAGLGNVANAAGGAIAGNNAMFGQLFPSLMQLIWGKDSEGG